MDTQREPARHLSTSRRGRDFITDWEGKHLRAYKDTAGIWTIGVGHTGPEVHEGQRITDAECDQLLRGDLFEAEREVHSCVKVPLLQTEFDALVSWEFNTGALRKSTLLKRLNAGRYDLVDNEMRRWNKARDAKTGKTGPVRGLTARRLSESELWSCGDYRTRNESTAFWESNTVPLKPELRDSDRPAPARKGVQGASLTGVGVAGTALTDASSTLSYSLGEMGPILQALFLVMTLAGVGLTVYAALKGHREESEA